MKAQVDPLKIIILMIILLVVAVVILAIFRNLIGKEAKEIEKKIAFQDQDDDGIADFLDSCPCAKNNDKDSAGKCINDDKDSKGKCNSIT